MLRPLIITAAAVALAAVAFLGNGADRRAQPNAAGQAPAAPEVALIAPPLIRSEGAATPVQLREAVLNVSTDGGFARSTLLLTLYNPNDRVLEGTLEFPLQPGQQVSGFALDVDGALRDAVPVPKPKAQQVFESIERRNVDPGLLEQTSGNHFRLRVYPVPPRGTRQVRIVIDEAMARQEGEWRLALPVDLLAGADAFSLDVQANGLRAAPKAEGAFDDLRFARSGRAWRAQIARSDFRPRTGLALRLPAVEGAATFVQRVGDERYAMVDVPLGTMVGEKRSVPRHIGLLWDASASGRKRDIPGEFALLDRYFSAMGEGRVQLRLLRDIGEDAGSFEIRNGDWSRLRAVLQKAVYDGASDLGDWRPDPAVGEYLLVSDGLQNYGSGAFPALRDEQALYVLNSAGAASDSARLAALAEARGGRMVAWQGSAGVAAAAAALLSVTPRLAELEGQGIVDLQPQSWLADGRVLRIAGRLTEPQARLRFAVVGQGEPMRFDVRIDADAAPSVQVAQLWANWRIAALAEAPERHRAEIARLGQRFGIVTPGTSLLALEAPEDYVRYDIPAPVDIAERVEALRATQARERTQTRSARLDEVAGRFAERLAWWQREFPKRAPPRAKLSDHEAPPVAMESPAPMSAPPPPPAPMQERSAAAEQEEAASRRRVLGQSARAESLRDMPAGAAADQALAAADAAADESGAAPGEGVSIRLQPWAPDSEYARRLRDAAPNALYALYLDERDSHAESTAFYLDVADLLLKKGRRAEALRVLSNLAELKLENRHVLRVLGYRLMQAEDYARAVEIFREVLRLADEEPQSHRDLGLALAAAGDRQQGIVHLYDVVARTWDARFSEVELVALNELNAIAATSTTPLDTAFIDPRLLRNMPLDLRVALAWDSDNSDMDLWVTDPNGERCYYGNKLTYQGGLISDDFTGGYGPEEFVLRDARPGKYRVEANFFGDRQQIVTGATTLTLRLSTGWGTRTQRDQVVTLRLSGQSETVLVGEFEVK